MIAMSNKPWAEIRDEAHARVKSRDDDVIIAEPVETPPDDVVVDFPTTDRRYREPPIGKAAASRLDVPMVSKIEFEAALVAERALRIAACKQINEQINELASAVAVVVDERIAAAAAETVATIETRLAALQTKLDAAIARLEKRERSTPSVDDAAPTLRAH